MLDFDVTSPTYLYIFIAPNIYMVKMQYACVQLKLIRRYWQILPYHLLNFEFKGTSSNLFQRVEPILLSLVKPSLNKFKSQLIGLTYFLPILFFPYVISRKKLFYIVILLKFLKVIIFTFLINQIMKNILFRTEFTADKKVAPSDI